MDESRRRFLSIGVGIAGAGTLASATQAAEGAAAPMVAACGLSCAACPLMKAGKCKGCATGKVASAAMLKMKPCPVLQCAAKKQVDYCGTGCKMFTQCKKIIGRPYAALFMEKIKKRLEA